MVLVYTAVFPGCCFRFYAVVRDVNASGECCFDLVLASELVTWAVATDVAPMLVIVGIGVGATIAGCSFVFNIRFRFGVVKASIVAVVGVAPSGLVLFFVVAAVMWAVAAVLVSILVSTRMLGLGNFCFWLGVGFDSAGFCEGHCCCCCCGSQCCR